MTAGVSCPLDTLELTSFIFRSCSTHGCVASSLQIIFSKWFFRFHSLMLDAKSVYIGSTRPLMLLQSLRRGWTVADQDQCQSRLGVLLDGGFEPRLQAIYLEVWCRFDSITPEYTPSQ